MSTGPFVKTGDKLSDREIWAAEMKPESEKKFDQYHQIKAVNEAAKKELAIRKGELAFESLMEVFTGE